MTAEETIQNALSVLWNAGMNSENEKQYIKLNLIAQGLEFGLEQIKEITWRPIPEYGDLMTIEEFTQDCKDGNFTNYDGVGHYSLKDKVSNIGVSCLFVRLGIIDDRFTHVMWFNK